MKIAIQGELGSFSHEAALQMLPKCTVVPCAKSREVFDSVVAGAVHGAVIPVENTLAGSVAEHLDLLFSHKVFIQAEHRLRIIHNLIVSPGVKLKKITKVYSHPIALDQCRDFFHKNPQIKAIPYYDTAGSVKHIILENLFDAAAIASQLAAVEYNADILKKGIEDDKQNFTRFFLISPHKKVLPDANKISIAFSVKNQPGMLFKALSVFALRDINLSKIESRPVRGQPWEYLFYVDLLQGENATTLSVLKYLQEFTQELKVLGVYPAAK